MNNIKVGIKERFFGAKSKEEVLALVQELNEYKLSDKYTPSAKTIRYCQRIANKWGVK